MLANWVKETTATTGTGTITLAGAETGFIAFGTAFSDGDVVYYNIEDGNNREIGIGTFTLAGTLLARTTVLETLVAGVFDNTAPVAITLSGNAVITVNVATQTLLPLRAGLLNHRADSQFVVDPWTRGTSGNRSMIVSWAFITPFCLNSQVTLSGLGIDVKTLATTGGSMQIGLYRQNPVDNTMVLIDQTGVIDVSTATGSTGYNSSNFSTGNIVLTPEVLFMAVGSDSDAVVDGVNLAQRGHPFMSNIYDNPGAGMYYTTAYSSGLPASLAAADHNSAGINGVFPNPYGVLV